MTAQVPPEWRRREKHHLEVKAMLGGDELDDKGRLRRWHGKKSIGKLASIGHTSVGYDTCDCRLGGSND